MGRKMRMTFREKRFWNPETNFLTSTNPLI